VCLGWPWKAPTTQVVEDLEGGIKTPTWRAGGAGSVVVGAELGVAGAWQGGVSSAHGRARGVSPAHLCLLVTSLRLLKLGTLAIRGLKLWPFFGLVSACRRPEPFTRTRRSLGGGQLGRKTCRGPASDASTSKRSPRGDGIGIRLLIGWAGGIYRFRAVCWMLEHVGLRRILALRALKGPPILSKTGLRAHNLHNVALWGQGGSADVAGAAARIAEIRSKLEAYPAE